MLIVAILVVACNRACSQSDTDSISNKINLKKWSLSLERKIGKLEERIIAKSERVLLRLQKQEEKIYKKQLATKDSLVAKARFAEIQSRYQSFKDQLKSPASILPNSSRQYLGHLDTVKTAFEFLNTNKQTAEVKNALSKIESFEGKMQQADEIKRFIRERKEQLKQQLEQLGLIKDLKRFNKQAYYYSEQLKEYKAILNDPDKIEKKAIEVLSKTSFFQNFMRKNSSLAALFPVRGDPTSPAYVPSLAGLQTRAQVNNLIQQQLVAGGPNARQQFSDNMQQAQVQLQQLKSRLGAYGSGSSDDIAPDGFKPNSQKSKSFLKRLELGTNLQTQRGSNILPVTSDLGLSVGYKINDRSIIGIGASYKLGWGRSLRNIRISQEGAAVRSYVDWKLKGSFWLSGGWELNYRSAFSRIAQLYDVNAWQQSGLIGLSKVLNIKMKFFRKTKLQLLWDFLSYRQIPRANAILFRIGYNF